jgi:hypothetical protein
MTAVLVQRGIASLRDQFLVQCSEADVPDVLGMLRVGAGLVVTGGKAHSAASRLRAQGWAGPLLVDRKRYAGSARVMAGAGLTPGWIAAQREAGVTMALTDSGYLADGDVSGLALVLAQAALEGGDVIATLPIAQEWLRGGLSDLVREVNAHGVPVALIVEHRDDPYSVQANLVGLVELLRRATVRVIILRCDVSALAAMAFGAYAGAFGVRSSLRHLCPPSKGFSTSPKPTALFDAGLYMVHVDRLALGVAAMPQDPMWLCNCLVCGGGSVDGLLLRSSTQVLAHTLELLMDRRDSLVQAPRGELREQSWRAQCKSAEYQFASLAMTRAGFVVPPALRWWQTV